ncbi:uncharacterized protein [Aegilops tauschii subsp. strangulata]|uniref:uncharacterized protein n=1 Tax=Aegilops tauschii subsp. strangulata TaxID=200361 RepID=UPI003CC88E31
MESTGQTHDIMCCCCNGGGHYARECPSKRVTIVTEDGGYDSTSDYDEDTLALITSEEHGGDDSDHETQYMAAEDADRYERLVARHFLSVQVTQAEQNQRHNLFHTKGVVKERSVRVIVDGGSCNNLASMEMVEKLSLTTRPLPHPYYIQWFNKSGKVKVTRTVRVHFSISTYADYVDCDVVPMQVCSLLLSRPCHSRAAPLPAGATACACCELLCAASPHPRYGHRHHTRTPPAFAVHHTRPLASPPATGALAAIVACGSSHPPPPNLAACCSERATPRPPPPGRASSARPRRPRLSSVPPRLASAPPPEAAATSSPALARAAPAVASPAPPPPLRRPPAGSARTGRAPARARPTPTPASGAR